MILKGIFMSYAMFMFYMDCMHLLCMLSELPM